MSMQFCSHFQCAHNGTNCVRGCEHRQNLKGASAERRAVAQEARRTMPCFETQPGAGPVYCVSIDNFLGTAFKGLCVSYPTNPELAPSQPRWVHAGKESCCSQGRRLPKRT